jgi:hypothetical protein
VPKDLEFNFRKVMLYAFDEKPDYEGLKANLRKCIHKINSEQNPVCPPSHRPLKPSKNAALFDWEIQKLRFDQLQQQRIERSKQSNEKASLPVHNSSNRLQNEIMHV